MDRTSIANFCAELSMRMDRPVLDTTRLEGTFRFDVGYGKPGLPATIPAALEQIGLNLEAKKGAVEMLIVENATRKP
jgi:uncharacterized protein (TIGR03435 family)